MSVSGCRDDAFNGEFGSRGEEITILACAAIFSIVGAMKLHLYFCSSYLAQKPRGKRCNALRLLHPTSLRQFAGVVWLSAEPCQSNKRGDLRPEFFIMPPFKIAGPGFGAR